MEPRTPEDLSLSLGKGNFLRLAQLTGLSRKHVSEVLQGKTGVTLKVIRKIASAAQVQVGDLVNYIEMVKSDSNGNGNDNGNHVESTEIVNG